MTQPGFFDIFLKPLMTKGKYKVHKKKEGIAADIDLKAFYNDFYNIFIEKKWKDTKPLTDNIQKKGEHNDPSSNLNRTGDMFEKAFIMRDLGDGVREFELHWEAKHKIPHSDGTIYFTLDLVCRRMVEKEILVGNKKKKIQNGTWEFRNKFDYENKIILNRISKIPIVGKSEKFQEFYLKIFYAKHVERDIQYLFGKARKALYTVINEHFSSTA